MTEPFDPAGAQSAMSSQGESHSTAADSFGAMLRHAREARGLSAGEIGARLQLRERTVRALENEDFPALPQSAYVRGFARKYAALVGIDQVALLSALDRRLQPDRPLQLGDGSAMNPVQLAAREQFSRIAVIGGALLSLAVFAVAGWFSMRPAAEPTAGSVAAPSAPRGQSGRPSVLQPPAATEPAQGAPAQDAIPAATSKPVAAPADAPPSNAKPLQAVPATALVFDFRERTWVQIVQSDGKVLMSQTNEAGTQRVVDGKPPYEVVIGNARGVQLEYRGEPVAVEPLATRDNVARLRLN